MRRDRALDGDEYVINGRKYWPCNVAGWDGKGANLNLVVVRTDPEGRHRGLSAIMVERGTPGISYNSIKTLGQRQRPNCGDHLRQRPRAGGEPDRGHAAETATC